MIPELGHFALILALSVAVVQGVLPLVGAQKGIASWIALARPAALGQFLFVITSYSIHYTKLYEIEYRGRAHARR